MSKYKVTIGKEFEIVAVEMPKEGLVKVASDAAGQLREANTRRILSYSVVAATLIALVAATAIDMISRSGSWSATAAVWGAAAFPLGYVFGHYFSKRP